MKLLILFSILFYSLSVSSSEAIGFYSKGKIKNPSSIDDYSVDLIRKLYRKRGQIYGTSQIMDAIDGLARFMYAKYPTVEVTQVGDISANKGRRIKRHKSHQNGLDVDIVYYRTNEKAQDVDYPEWAEDFVIKGRLTSNFHIERNWSAMKYLVNNHDVGRVFVDGKIKKAFCDYAKLIGELKKEEKTLRRLRIENSVHMHHFHLRLKCPIKDSRCKAQVEPPTGNGC